MPETRLCPREITGKYAIKIVIKHRPETVIVMELLKSVNLQSPDTIIIFDDDSFFTNVPVDKVLQVIRNKLHSGDRLAGRSVLQVEAIMELLEVCLFGNHIFSGGR
jgi:S-adenosylmethionine:diacylglycerol 3-amino-3-carboxypropyl transferase